MIIEAQKTIVHSKALKQEDSAISLTNCQTIVLQKLATKSNLFLTGHAGTGKSYLISKYLRNLGNAKEFPVLASTGASAVLIGGRTFHSFFGLGVMQGRLDDVVSHALKNRKVGQRLRKANTIIIDEVSMLSGPTLAAAEEIARKSRKSEEPWGNIRIIAVGDFAQLPPVAIGSTRPWGFLDPVWEFSQFEPALLKTTVRAQDHFFILILNQIREGSVTEELTNFLEARKQVPDPFLGTRLFPYRRTTEQFNLECLEKLPAKEVEFKTEFLGEERYVEYLKNNCPVPESLFLKVGALVMIRINDPLLRYVNGSVGTVKEINKDKIVVQLRKKFVEIEKYTFSYLDGDGNERATAKNFPLTLAWASTIHKAQGATLEQVLVDLKGLWEPGQAYVALSRSRRAEDLFISQWNPKSIQTDRTVVEFYKRGCPYDFSTQIDMIQT